MKLYFFDAPNAHKACAVVLAGRTFTVRKRFLEDLKEQCSAKRIGALRKALLIFHAPLDAIVGIDNAGEIFQGGETPQELRFARRRRSSAHAPGARDLRRRSAGSLGEPLLAGPAEAEVPGRPEGGEVLVAETGQGRFQQVVRVGRHELRADEPKSFGGDDTGPGPYDYLLAGLGACISMTVRVYAERKGLPLEVHEQVFTWVLEQLAERGLVKGERIGVDASTMEANAAIRTIRRRDSSESYREMLTRMAEASGIATPSAAERAAIACLRDGFIDGVGGVATVADAGKTNHRIYKGRGLKGDWIAVGNSIRQVKRAS